VIPHVRGVSVLPHVRGVSVIPHVRGVFLFYHDWGGLPPKGGGGPKIISHPNIN